MASTALSPSTSSLSMGLISLSLTHFRNFRDQSLRLELAPVILLGANGAGKSNCLEAISYFAPGSGLRQAHLMEPESQLPRNEDSDSSCWAVHGKYIGRYGEFSLGTGRTPPQHSDEREKRQSRINGAPIKSQSAFSEILSLQWLTPKVARLFEDSPASRRRFLDRLVQSIDPAHARRISQYDHILRQRNRLLEQYGPSDSEQSRWLDGLEQEAASLAVAIAAARADVIQHLNRTMQEGLGVFPQAHLRLEGSLDTTLQERPALSTEEWLRDRLLSHRGEDARLGQCTHGAHKSDLHADYLGRKIGNRNLSASLCSTGEQKALILAILLASARLTRALRQEPPLLLLDDGLTGLDEKRRLGLFEELHYLGTQAWMTGTDSEPFKPFQGKAQFFHLEDGRIGPS